MRITAGILVFVALTGVASAQQTAPPKPGATPPKTGASAAKPGPKTDPVAPTTLPADYLIGVNDVLNITTDVELKGAPVVADVMVRPDGKISLLMVNDIQAAGLKPDDLRQALVTAFTPFKSEPSVLVNVKQINSRFVFITGAVNKSGSFPLTEHMRVSQLIALAGGLQDWADKENIVITRNVNGQLQGYRFNYKEVTNLKKMSQDIELKAGDVVLVKGG